MMKRTMLVMLIAGVLAGSVWADEQPTCAMLTLEPKGGLSDDTAALLTDRFASELNRLGAYRLMPREKMKEVLEAQEFSRTCASADCAVEAGNLLSIQKIVYGTVGVVGKTHTVSAHVVDVRSGKTERSASYDVTGAVDDLLRYGMAAVASELIERGSGRSGVVASATLPRGREDSVGAVKPEGPEGESWLRRNWGWAALGTVLLGGLSVANSLDEDAGENSSLSVVGAWAISDGWFEGDVLILGGDGSAQLQDYDVGYSASGNYSTSDSSVAITVRWHHDPSTVTTMQGTVRDGKLLCSFVDGPRTGSFTAYRK